MNDFDKEFLNKLKAELFLKEIGLSNVKEKEKELKKTIKLLKIEIEKIENR